MAKLKKDTTYYVGKPFKLRNVYKQAVVYVDSNLKKHTSSTYSKKARDFSDGFMGFGVSERAIRISAVEFNKLTK